MYEDQTTARRAIEVLNECAELMAQKGKAYNRVPQAEYYDQLSPLFKDGIGGAGAIFVMMHQKMTRIKSLLSADGENNFESLEDSILDLINYSSFLIEHLEGKMEGQNERK